MDTLIFIVFAFVAIGLLLKLSFWLGNIVDRKQAQLNRTTVINNWQLEEAISLADRHGKKYLFLEYLVAVRTKFGHGAVTVGHIEWIHSNVGQGIRIQEIQDIPAFNQTDKRIG